MKKILLVLLAVAALVGCTKDNVLDDNKEAIGFSNAFIENSVKSASDPSLTVGTLSDFAVYGFVEGATLFDGTTVNKTITNDELAAVAGMSTVYFRKLFTSIMGVSPITYVHQFRTEKAKEMLAMRLCVLHNLYFFNSLMEEIRQAIEEDRFHEYKKQKLEDFKRSSGK